MRPLVAKLVSWITTLAIPFFLIMTAVRLLITPLYPQVEYRMPGFPPDTYGFTFEERMHWANISINYLLNNQGIEYLSNQRLADGAPLYNERELSHMLDVKVLVQKMIVAWYILLAALISFGIWAWRGGWLPEFLHGLGNGGKLTIGLIVLILAAVAISFNGLFTSFHQLFFTGDSWLFLYTDSLIRLFPLRFWQDGFIGMGIFTLVGAGLLIWAEQKFAYR